MSAEVAAATGIYNIVMGGRMAQGMEAWMHDGASRKDFDPDWKPPVSPKDALLNKYMHGRIGCDYCGREEQTPHRKTCDGCGSPRRAYGRFVGKVVTDPLDACELMKLYGYGVIRPDWMGGIRSSSWT